MGGQFAMIPLEMLRDSRLLALDSAVYASIDGHSDKQGNSWPGLRTIAVEARVSRPTVIASLNRLELAGYIRKTKRRRDGTKEFGHNLYALRLRRGGVVNDIDHVVNNIDQGGKSPLPRGKARLLGVVNDVYSNHNHKNHKKEKEYPPFPGGKPPEPPSSSEAPTQTSPPAEPPTPWDTPSPQTEAPTPEGIPPKDEGASGVSKITDSRNADNGEGETAEGAKATTEAEHWAEVDAYFSRFWDGYPRKEGKADARAMFRKLFPPGKDPESYFARLREIDERMGPFLDRAEELKRCGDQKFIPKPANWLKREFGDV